MVEKGLVGLLMGIHQALPAREHSYGQNEKYVTMYLQTAPSMQLRTHLN